jgi:ABC-type bacteriocin/lantibiotic exporter with double-glycine peptidase domain
VAAVWSFKNKIAKNTSFWQGDIDEDPALHQRTIYAAERAQPHHFIEDLPNGYQTQVGDRGVRLSGGQRREQRDQVLTGVQQSLFVARELFNQPEPAAQRGDEWPGHGLRAV